MHNIISISYKINIILRTTCLNLDISLTIKRGILPPANIRHGPWGLAGFYSVGSLQQKCEDYLPTKG